MALVADRRYPDYETYRGRAYLIKFRFGTLRVGIPPLDEFTEWLATKVVEGSVALRGGRMIYQKVWREASSWNFIPTWAWSVEAAFHLGEGAEASLVAPEVVAAIIELIKVALIVVAIWFALTKAEQILWPREEVPLIAWAVLLAAGGLAVTPIIIEALRRI